MPGDVVFDIQI